MGILLEQYTSALSNASVVVRSDILEFLVGQVEMFDSAMTSDPRDKVNQHYFNELSGLMRKNGWVTDPVSISEFSQKLGEAIFYCSCKKENILLDRIPEGEKSTPDFKAVTDEDLFFEVKTLSYVDGNFHIGDDLAASLEANIELERQSKEGLRVSSVVREISPLTTDRSPIPRDQRLTHVIKTLIQKTTQNLKASQFPSDTILVLNLSVTTFSAEPATLCPAYQGESLWRYLRTGELWSLGFITPGTPIYATPEFEGATAIDKVPLSERNYWGILANEEYEYVKGIVIMTKELDGNEDTKSYGLIRNVDYFDKGKRYTPFFQLVKDNWNDEYNSNGYYLLPDLQG